MGFLDKLLGRNRPAAERVQGDESPGEVQTAAHEQAEAADPTPEPPAAPEA